MDERDKFERLMGEICEFFDSREATPHEAFVAMSSAIGAIIAQLPEDRREGAVDLARETIYSALNAAMAGLEQ